MNRAPRDRMVAALRAALNGQKTDMACELGWLRDSELEQLQEALATMLQAVKDESWGREP